MITEIDYRKTQIGEVLNKNEMRGRCLTVWGGVAWPGKRPGFVVVLLMDNKQHLGGHDIFLIDEFESFDTRELVRQIGAMDVKYGILGYEQYDPESMDSWIGDNTNDAADSFIAEMNDQIDRKHEQMILSYTMLLEMKNVYSYILPFIKDLLNTEKRLLFLKDSKVIDYLSEIEEIDMAELKIGDYPAIEALGFTAIEMQNQVASNKSMPEKKDSYNYDPLNAREL